MIKTDEQHGVSLDFVSGVLGIPAEDVEAFEQDNFNVLWFLKTHHLLTFTPDSDGISKIISNGFLKSAALMKSLLRLDQDTLSKMLYDRTPVDIALMKILELSTCGTQEMSFDYFDNTLNWFSIQYGCYNINLPNYLWWLAVDVVLHVTANDQFFVSTGEVLGLPVIQLSFGKYGFEPVRDCLEYDLPNLADPLLQTADDFMNLGFVSNSISYLEKVTYVYQLVQLYNLDANWRYAFNSPMMERLVTAYAPGDSFFDALWKCLHDDVDWVVKPAEHLLRSTVDIFGVKADLLDYAIHPSLFIKKIGG